MPEKNVRELIVTDLKELATGTGNTGKPYVLYQVRATHADGRVIPDMKLRTFEELPLNEVIKVRIEVKESENFGTSYTLFQVGGERKSAGEELVKTVKELVRRVAHLEGLLGERAPARAAADDPGKGSGSSSNVRVQPPIGPPLPDATPPPTPPTTGGEGPNDSIPF